MHAQCAPPERLDHLYRAIRTLSGCNRALLHAADELALLEEVCQVVVNDAGYPLAWVVRVEHDAAKTIHPIAHAGFDEVGIDSLNMSHVTVDGDGSPTRNAIQTGKPSIARKASQAPGSAAWHEDWSKLGIASTLSLPLPLRIDGEIFGAMVIGASEPDAFSEKEIELLGEAFDDLAFGIQALRTKAKHRRAELEIRGLNRVLMTRVAVNHALIHATDEMALLKEVCRVLVVDCGLRWFNFLGHLDRWKIH